MSFLPCLRFDIFKEKPDVNYQSSSRFYLKVEPTQMKTLEANVVKSLFAVLSKLSLKVLQCHRRQTKRFFRNFLAIFCAFGASNGTCQVWCKSRHKWPN